MSINQQELVTDIYLPPPLKKVKQKQNKHKKEGTSQEKRKRKEEKKTEKRNKKPVCLMQSNCSPLPSPPPPPPPPPLFFYKLWIAGHKNINVEFFVLEMTLSHTCQHLQSKHNSQQKSFYVVVFLFCFCCCSHSLHDCSILLSLISDNSMK